MGGRGRLVASGCGSRGADMSEMNQIRVRASEKPFDIRALGTPHFAYRGDAGTCSRAQKRESGAFVSRLDLAQESRDSRAMGGTPIARRRCRLGAVC